VVCPAESLGGVNRGRARTFERVIRDPQSDPTAHRLTLVGRGVSEDAVDFRIEADITSSLRDLERLEGQLKHRVLGRVLNRTATGVRTDVSRHIRSILNVRAQDVNKRLSIRRAARGEGTADIVIGARGLPLLAFGARQTRKGVSVKVLRRGGRKLVRGAFIATMKSGHRGVFVRRGAKALPIDERFGEMPAQTILRPNVIAEVSEKARARFERELAHELKRRGVTR
jgi:hypothetical protein